MKSPRQRRMNQAGRRPRRRRSAIVSANGGSQPAAGAALRRHLSVVRGDGGPAAAVVAAPEYEWLSAEDRMFLKFEGPNAHMHVGATLLFEGRSLLASSGSVDVRRIRQHIAAQLPAIPRYRQRLHRSPVDGAPVWIDDEHFNLAEHVRHVRVERPGDIPALQRLASRILSQPLDRRRPLWEMWVVDGLADGRVAIVNKTHHCMVDGIAGADLLTILLSPSPNDTTVRAPGWMARPAPLPSMLMRDRIARQKVAARAAAAELWRVVRHPGAVAEWGRYASAFWQALGLGVRSAPDSPLNRPIGPHRRFVWLAVDLREVKQIKNQLGGTVNDVVLATVAGAMRRFLLHRDPDGAPPDLRALVPVNTRSGAEASALGNHVGAWIMPLPTGEARPLHRLARIRTVTAALKGANDAFGAELLSAAGTTLLGFGVRLLERLRPFNLVVTNVPGPPLPLYLLGARLESVYPLVPLFPNQGLGVAVFSYADTLCWGLNADCHVLPDLEALATAVEAAFRELAEAAQMAAQPHSHGARRHQAAV